MNFKWSYVWLAMSAALEKYHVTMSLAVSSFVLAFVLGTLIAMVRVFKIPVLHRIVQALTIIGKGIPIVLMIYIVNYAVLGPIDYFADLFGHPAWKQVDKYWLLMIAFVIFGTVNITEVMRGALAAVPAGQYEAAYSIGMKRWKTMFRIVFPQAFKAAVPSLCNNFIGQLKYTSMAYLLSVMDVTNAALVSVLKSYRYIEAYTALAILYWITSIAFERIFAFVERKMGCAPAKKKRRALAR